MDSLSKLRYNTRMDGDGCRCVPAQGTACLVLEGKDKMISLTGRQEASWGDVITFRGDSISYRFVADTDGDDGAGKSLVDDAGLDDWGFRFTVRMATENQRESERTRENARASWTMVVQYLCPVTVVSH